MRKKRLWIVLPIAAYLAVLALLVYVERFSPESCIRSFRDALWYSVVTLTTVGYGDFYPVTAAGRLIGGIFLVMSVGFFAVLVSACIALLYGKLLSGLRCRLVRARPWYVFSAANACSVALAENIMEQDSSAVFMFLSSDGVRERCASIPRRRRIIYSGTLRELICLKRGGGELRVFIMGDDGADNYCAAVSLADCDCRIYCMTEFEPSTRADKLRLFNKYDCCARMYWQNEPADAHERSIVIIGGGRYGESILSRALLTNVFSTDQHIAYHVYGDYARFLAEHPMLDAVITLNALSAEGDSLFFHGALQTGDIDIIENADRIIICAESDEENMDVLCSMHRCYALRGRVHVHLLEDIGEMGIFGGDRQVFTPELVMGIRQDRLAMAMHAIYSRSVSDAPSWAALSEFQRQSNIAAADHVAVKVRLLLGEEKAELTPELCESAYRCYMHSRAELNEEYRAVEHMRWLRFHAYYNWRFAPVRDNAMRRHPLMIPYSSLTAEEQTKDDFAWELIGELANERF